MTNAYNSNDYSRTESDKIGAGVVEAKEGMVHAVRGAGEGASAGLAEMREGAHHVVEAAKSKLHDAQHMVSEKACGAKHAVEAGYDDVKVAIGKNPMLSVGIAAGVGVLIGLVLCRPRS